MSYITKDGIWAPHGHIPLVPEDRPAQFVDHNIVGRDYYVNPNLWKEAYSQAVEPVNAWEMIKFAGEIYVRQIETLELPAAEWPAIGRGAYQPVVQVPNVVSGNLYEMVKHDRYGPFRDPRQSQSSLDAFQAWAMPQQVDIIEAASQYQTGNYIAGFGAPGG